MKRQREQKKALLYPSSNQTLMFPVMWAVWLLKVHADSKSDWAKKEKKDPASPAGFKGPGHRLTPLRGTHRNRKGLKGSHWLCLCCSIVCTTGKLATAGGSLDGPLITPCPAVLMVLKWEVKLGILHNRLLHAPKPHSCPRKRKKVVLVKKNEAGLK